MKTVIITVDVDTDDEEESLKLVWDLLNYGWADTRVGEFKVTPERLFYSAHEGE